jgi:Putative prokaryotic signal transducing protein
MDAPDVDPRTAGGEPVRVARAANQAEAEFIAGLLLEEGIPSLVRRAPGADVPDFLAAGPREVLVPQSAAQRAREALAQRESSP